MALEDLPPDARKKVRALYQSLQNPERAGTLTDMQRLEGLRTLVEHSKLDTMVPLLPMAFNLNGEPYDITEGHFPFEPLFNRHLPDNLIVKSGRQVSKSTSQASRSLLISTNIPHFTTLFVTPLYEQVCKFSTEYVAKFIRESPLKQYWSGTDTVNSVLHRSFKNFSKMFFSFAGLSADRIRGISASMCCFDEVQDLDPNHLPVIRETMSASRFGTGLSVYTGTPKTRDNTLQYEWERSSQAEWVIPCPACKKDNFPVLGLDLDKMIGRWHEGIGRLRPPRNPRLRDKAKMGVPGIICARCGHWLDPQEGRWLHKVGKLKYDYPGYHIPQIIMPLHCEDPKRWRKLIGKQNGAENYTPAKFYNEVLGESYDVGAKLITDTQLQRACTLGFRNNPQNFRHQAALRNNYIVRFLGVDWGGGGEEEVSFTTAAVCGLRGDGRIDTIYGERLLLGQDPLGESRRLMQIFNAFQCSHFAHDYNGAGNLRETFMIQAGLNLERVVPFVYNRTAAQDVIVPHFPADKHHRRYYILDKARAIQYVCELIKLCQIRFFDYDFVDVDNRGLIRDFLSLIEHKTETARAGEVYSIHRIPAFPDDFAHSITFACWGIWHHTQQFPNIASIARLVLSAQQLEAYGPTNLWSGPGEVDQFINGVR